MFRVVTVAREYGSGGGRIAQMLAGRLGWKLVDRCLVEKIAEAARIEPQVAEKFDERPDPWFDRLANLFWLSPGGRGYIWALCPSVLMRILPPKWLSGSLKRLPILEIA